jgi:hypothetical protein
LVTSDYRWFAADGSFFTSRTIGFAYDHSDKAANKAMTAARKYNICQTLSIPTSDPKDVENENIETGPRIRHAPQQRAGGGYATKEEAMAAAEAKRAAAAAPMVLPSGITMGPAPGTEEVPPTKKPAAERPKSTRSQSSAAEPKSAPQNTDPIPKATANASKPEEAARQSQSEPDAKEIRTERPGSQELLQVFQAGQPKGWSKEKLNAYVIGYLANEKVDTTSKTGILDGWTWKHFETMVRHLTTTEPS